MPAIAHAQDGYDDPDVGEGLVAAATNSESHHNPPHTSSRFGKRTCGIAIILLTAGVLFVHHAETRLSIHVALCAGGIAPWTRGRRPPVHLVAHRGCEFPYPENTLPALVYGAQHLKFVEMDITLSSDNHVVLMHDETVDRTSNGTGVVCEHALEYIQQLALAPPTVKPAPEEEPGDVISCPDASLPGAGTRNCVYRIPTLDSVFETLPGDTRYMLDLKVCYIPGLESTSTQAEKCNPCKKLAASVKKLMAKHRIETARAVFTSTDVHSLSHFADTFPTASFALSVDHHFAAHTASQFMRILEEHDFDAVAMYFATAGLRPDLVRAVRSSRSARSRRLREVYAWTIRRKPHEHIAQCSGVDNFIVADPGLWVTHPMMRVYSCNSR